MHTGSAPPTTARRAICDADRRVVAYEVVVRGLDGREATLRRDAHALLEAWTSLDLDLLSARLPAYVTVAPELLGVIEEMPMAPERVVVQLDCSRPLDGRTLAAARRVMERGHALAATCPKDPAVLEALGGATMARVDVAGLRPPEIAAALRPFEQPGIEVHALGVATHEAFEACRDAGAAAFQGSFRALPRLAWAPPPSSTLLTCSDLLDPDAELEQLERVISQDLSLQFRLLRYINSAFFAQRRQIATAREAITILGEHATRRWALIVTLGLARGSRPDGLLVDALLRGRMLEKLSLDVPGAQPDRGFAVGLFSLLEGLLDVPLETALSGLPLPDDVAGALVHGAAPYGPLLARVARYLDGDFGGAERGVALERFDAAFLSALGWTESLRPELEAVG